MPAHFGLDIGSTSIKIVKSEEKRISVISVVSNSSGKNLMNMLNTEKIALADQIKEMMRVTGLKERRVVASIPESLVFSRIMKFPIMSSPELATAIKWELDQSVPFPPNEVETSWSVLEKPNKIKGDEKISVYIVAVPTPVSEAYVQLLELLELEPLRLENEIPALIRTFSSISSNDDPLVIADIGASGIGLMLTGRDRIFSNYYLPFGGTMMTKLIADAFGLPLTQAESYKRTYGMAKGQLEDKMFVVLKPVVDNLASEIKKMAIAYQDEHKGSSVGRVILTGGGAYLNGLVPYLTESLAGIEIVIGDPFSGLSVDQKYKPLGSVFAVSYGLSMDTT